jgi:hypothetical protein
MRIIHIGEKASAPVTYSPTAAIPAAASYPYYSYWNILILFGTWSIYITVTVVRNHRQLIINFRLHMWSSYFWMFSFSTSQRNFQVDLERKKVAPYFLSKRAIHNRSKFILILLLHFYATSTIIVTRLTKESWERIQ